MTSSGSPVELLALQTESEKDQGWEECASSLTKHDPVTLKAQGVDSATLTANIPEYGQSASSKSKGKEKEVDVHADVRDPTEATPETTVEEEENEEEEKQVLNESVLHGKDEAESRKNEEWTCAICLDSISMEELSLIKGCEHAYCTHCILKWAAFNAEKTQQQQSRASCESTVGNPDPVCPTCKHPFNTLVTARALDGTVRPHLEEESLSLLLRALWFAEGASLSRLGFSAAPFARSSADCYDVCEHDEDDDFYDYDDDYDIIAARVSRKVISNRKFGSGGVLQAGRLQARPVNNSNNGGSSSSHKSKGCSSKKKDNTPAQKPQESCSSGSAAASSAGCATTPKTTGRRAKRNAKRRQCTTV